jgi:hypothetical protein
VLDTNKILLNPPLEKGDEEKILPFYKGESEGVVKQKRPITFLPGNPAYFILISHKNLSP